MTARTFQPISGLADIAFEYDAIFCDIWGVVHKGVAPTFCLRCVRALSLMRSGTVV